MALPELHYVKFAVACGCDGISFLMASMHPTMHYGQVADARRTLGRKPAFG